MAGVLKIKDEVQLDYGALGTFFGVIKTRSDGLPWIKKAGVYFGVELDPGQDLESSNFSILFFILNFYFFS